MWVNSFLPQASDLNSLDFQIMELSNDLSAFSDQFVHGEMEVELEEFDGLDDKSTDSCPNPAVFPSRRYVNQHIMCMRV